MKKENLQLEKAIANLKEEKSQLQIKYSKELSKNEYNKF